MLTLSWLNNSQASFHIQTQATIFLTHEKDVRNTAMILSYHYCLTTVNTTLRWSLAG